MKIKRIFILPSPQKNLVPVVVLSTIFILVTSYGIVDAKIKNKGRSIMSYIQQPFSNPQQNSFVPYDLKSNGKNSVSLQISNFNVAFIPRYLLTLNDTQLVIDAFDVAALFNISTGALEAWQPKTQKAFITLSDSKIFNIHELLFVSETKDFSNNDLPGYFIPGIGDYGHLVAFVPFEEKFISVAQFEGNPRNQYPAIQITCRGYPGSRSIWQKEYSGSVLQAPVTNDGSIIIALPDKIILVNVDGHEKVIDKSQLIPKVDCVGPNGNIYIVFKMADGCILKAFDQDCKDIWNSGVAETDFTQPPVVSFSGHLFLVSTKSIECFFEGKLQWSYERTGFADQAFYAICSKNEKLVGVDGKRIFCLNMQGELLWEINESPVDTFITPPVIDPKGRILAATKTKIVVVE